MRLRSGGVAGAVKPARLDELAIDETFLRRLDELTAELNDYLNRPLWYQQQQDHGAEMPAAIAYFSMEFGIAEVLPNYLAAWASSPVTT